MAGSGLHNERQLLEQLAAGDEAAFRLLYDRYWNRIFSTALAATQSRQLAMDIVQDTFATIWKKRRDLITVENIEAYIYTAGRNRISSVMRSQRNHLAADLFSDHLAEDAHASPERQAALRQFKEKIQKAIDQLPAKQAEVFRLSRLEQFSYEEIAQQLGISKDTVRNHLIKALNFMRAEFEGRQGDLLFLILTALQFF